MHVADHILISQSPRNQKQHPTVRAVTVLYGRAAVQDPTHISLFLCQCSILLIEAVLSQKMLLSHSTSMSGKSA